MLDAFQSFFQSDFSGSLSFFRTIGFMLSLGFFIGIVYSIVSSTYVSAEVKKKRYEHFVQPEPKKGPSPRRQRWEDTADMFRSGNPTNWRVAIIDADSMLEELIIEMGYQGDTFADRLKAMQRAGVPWTDAAWDVHLLRNKVAHEGSRYPLTDREVFRAFKIYENILAGSGYLA